jgi:hypothetical protein
MATPNVQVTNVHVVGITPFLKRLSFEMGITGLSDMTFDMQVFCRSKRWQVK